MIGRGLFILAILSNCVLSLPLTQSQLENEDVQVMKCIVEALADVLSRPHPMPVSQECLATLRTDERLVSILRHHNFLKELQEIAIQGGQERAQLQRDAATPDPLTHTPQNPGDVADRSMLEALGGPGERSILSQKRTTGNGDGEEEKDLGDGESQEDSGNVKEVQTKGENDESPGSHAAESVDEWSEGKAEKSEEDEEEEYEEKRANSVENSEESMTKDKKGAGSGEKKDAPRNKSKEKKSNEEDAEEEDKRSALFSHKKEVEQEEEKDEGETKRGNKESLKRWTKRGKALSLTKKAVGKEAQQLNSQQEVPHHSKEFTEEEEEEKKKRGMQRSLEEKELQMIARRLPEEKRGSEEEGSASQKSEEPEIESLAAIESELENVAQKLHELRRG
ncbi:chromogranin-A [Micropterus dolomieu]|uniref:chromogranin-A n=1 Tax=Micropterus dolomieu TaxID=147949 RepID=UPI001E8EC69F|nr:chromogranin-A [Micropterus dolomieu]